MADRIAIQCVSTLCSLGDYAGLTQHLCCSEPSDVMTVADTVCGRVDDKWLSDYAGSPYQYSRAEQFVLALLDQQRTRLEQCLAGVDPQRVAVVMGTTAGGIAEAEFSRRPGHEFTDNYDFRFQRLGQVARFAAKQLGARGLITGVSTACTSGARAIGLGIRWLSLGWCDVAVAGGIDALCEMTEQGFASLEAVSPGFCRPFDSQRDGINLGEGGALLVLARQEPGERDRVSIAGYGESMDAWHMSAPHPEGAGIARAMQGAMAMSGRAPGDVGYINMHGTGTPHNDAMEGNAVLRVLGSGVPVSSTKTMTGHTLGAAGALEAAICYALLNGDLEVLPVQHGLREQDPLMKGLQVVVDTGRELDHPVVISNSCGFGGHNASLVLVR